MTVSYTHLDVYKRQIFAGPVPPNPSELVGNDRFAKMVEEARATFDMIIIDTPPIGCLLYTSRCV